MSGMIELHSNFIVERPVHCEWLVRQDEKTFEVDLTIVHKAESRREELVSASGRGLIELANIFDDGYDSACKLHAKILYEEEMATIASRKRRAVLMRDDFPRIVQERGLGSTKSPVGAADIRENLYYEDPEFIQVEQYRAALGALKELVWGKMFSLARCCKRAETLMQRKDSRQNGLGEHDQDGDRLEKTMAQVMDNKEIVVEKVPRRSGFATKVKDD